MPDTAVCIDDPAFSRQEEIHLVVDVDRSTMRVFVAFSEIDQSVRLTPMERDALQDAVLRARSDLNIPLSTPGIAWMADFCAYVVEWNTAPAFARDAFADGIIAYFQNALGYGRLRLTHCYCASNDELYTCQLAQSRLREARACSN